MRKLRHKRCAQTFAGIDQRIDQHDFLHDREICQRAPRIVRATEKDHRRHHQREHQADVRLLDAAPERQAAARGKERDEHRHDGEEKRPVQA